MEKQYVVPEVFDRFCPNHQFYQSIYWTGYDQLLKKLAQKKQNINEPAWFDECFLEIRFHRSR